MQDCAFYPVLRDVDWRRRSINQSVGPYKSVTPVGDKDAMGKGLSIILDFRSDLSDLNVIFQPAVLIGHHRDRHRHEGEGYLLPLPRRPTDVTPLPVF